MDVIFTKEIVSLNTICGDLLYKIILINVKQFFLIHIIMCNLIHKMTNVQFIFYRYL